MKLDIVVAINVFKQIIIKFVLIKYYLIIQSIL